MYSWNGDYFEDYNRVSDAGDFVKGNIYDFIENSGKIVVVVDCENSDPYKLCAVLKNLDNEFLSRIQKIILFDDVHTVDAWRVLEQYTALPVEHMMIERVKESKSLVDIRLTTRVCQEFYQNHVDSFILVSSDSDYWGLISSIQGARFLVMVEREKCGHDIKEALWGEGIFYCYIDDFYAGGSDEIRNNALFREMYRYIDNSVHLNVRDMLDNSLRATRISMSATEKAQFYERYIKNLQLSIDEDGTVQIGFKRK